MNEQQITQISIPDPGQALRPLHKQTKLTRKKKLEVLKSLGTDYNISKAAQSVGIHRQTLIKAIQTDPDLARAIDEVKQAWLDQVEQSGLKIAIQQSREGYNDRKFFLESHRPETYRPGPQVQINTQITIDNASQEVRSILDDIPVAQVTD